MKKIYLLFFLFISFTLGFFWSNFYDQNLKPDKYPFRIGYIYDGTKLDSVQPHAHKSLEGFYHSSAPTIYKGSKYQFRQKLLQAYQADLYQDNGYFNLRFYISNEGEVWLYEAKEMDFDFNSTQFTPGLREELIALSFKKRQLEPL